MTDFNMISENSRKTGLESETSILERVFGYGVFRQGQQEVISALNSCGAALAVFPTGGGKSLCYQLPALTYDGLTVVVSPLIALMKDQIDFLTRRGVAACRLDSSLTLAQQNLVNAQIASGAVKLLYVAPERFNNERFLAQMKRTKISLFAIDEAHCISQWGHNFRPDYLKLAELVREIGAERVLTLTATATPPVVADICATFSIPPNAAIVTGFYRQNLKICLTPTTSKERDSVLVNRLKLRARGSTIVYVTLQRTAERIAALLQSAGLDAKAYHAGMESEQRTAVQEWWMKRDDGIVVATIAFGMGIDKADVRYVYHYNMPHGLEAYSQEIGRAGRDGKPSVVELFACSEDLPTIENFAYGDTPTVAALRGLVAELLAAGEEFDISHYDLSDRHDIRPLVLKTVLTYLELMHVIRQGTPFYAGYAVTLNSDEETIIGQFKGEPAELVRGIFSNAKRGTSKGSVCYRLHPDSVAAALEQPRRRIVRALEVLAERDLVQLALSEVRQRYRRETNDNYTGNVSENLISELTERFERRESQAIAGLQRVVDLVVLDGCQTNALVSYFGEIRTQPCGHCTHCLSGKPSVMPPVARLPELPAGVDSEEIDRIKYQHPSALNDPRQRARFLCGLSSPAVSKARLSRNPLFGVWDNRRFHEVLEWCERNG